MEHHNSPDTMQQLINLIDSCPFMMFLPWQSLKIRRTPFDRTESIYIFLCFLADGVVDNLKCVAQQICFFFLLFCSPLLLCRKEDRGKPPEGSRGQGACVSPKHLFSILFYKIAMNWFKGIHTGAFSPWTETALQLNASYKFGGVRRKSSNKCSH